MALSKETLKTAIQNVFDSYPETTKDAADGIAAAYSDYCSAATFGSSTPTFTTQEASLAVALSGSMNGSFSSFATGVQTGLTAFWSAVPCAGGNGSGVTTPGTGFSSIASNMNSQLNGDSYVSTTEEAAEIIADILDTATKSVTATLTLPPNAPVVTPIS